MGSGAKGTFSGSESSMTPVSAGNSAGSAS